MALVVHRIVSLGLALLVYAERFLCIYFCGLTLGTGGGFIFLYFSWIYSVLPAPRRPPKRRGAQTAERAVVLFCGFYLTINASRRRQHRKH